MAGISFSVTSVVEDVLQQHGNRLKDLDLDSRRAEEAASRRNEAAGWLRKMIGVVAAKDLPAEPSEEEFRLGLRSGIILCNVLNKLQPGAVPKVVESPYEARLMPDGAPLSAFQYFENVRNFLVAVQEKGFPTFEASDLEQGGKSSRVVNCVLALKSYGDWKQTGGNGVWKFGGNIKSSSAGKSFVRKSAEPFATPLSRSSSINDKVLNSPTAESDSCRTQTSSSLSTLVRGLLSDKKPEEVPTLLESVLSKVAEEFEHRLANQVDSMKTGTKEITTASHGIKSFLRPSLGERQTEEHISKGTRREEPIQVNQISDDAAKNRLLKEAEIFNQQHKEIEELRNTLYTTKAGIQFMQKKFHDEFSNLGMHIHGLANAASGYHRVLEENRKLYNQVQDLKGSIRVYCRVRPFLSGQSSYLSTVENIEEDSITLSTASKHGKGHKSFSFNRVFGPSATQAEVFSDMQPLIRSVLDGYNVCIFAYGQTGSGKTFTMTGPRDLTEKSQGVNYRALSDLFLLAEQRKDTFRYDIAVQMIEIYNEQVRDLLVVDGNHKKLEIRNSSQTGLSVPDASVVSVSSTYDVIDLMKLGQKNRVVGATALNDRSSRSHSCLTVHVQGRDLTSGAVLRGCMHLVDLAGSERVDKSEVTGDRLKEAQHINKSLSALGDVIASLAQKNPHVPYRNSKLTQLLQDSLGGQAKTLMFVHISPDADSLGETISTLKFAERVATVELGAARVCKDTTDVKELKEQIVTLKAALARKEEAQQSKNSVSGSNERYKNKPNDLSPFVPSLREPDEPLANSPPWPPVASPGLNYGDSEREFCSDEWVDKVMVNKHEANRVQNLWGLGNTNLPDEFYQKGLTDSSRMFSEQSYNMFMGNNNNKSFNAASADDMDDLDAATSDSSEQDLLWQFNQPKLTTMANGVAGSKTKSPVAKSTKSPQLRNSNTMSRPSPSQKHSTGVGGRGGKQLNAADMKRKSASRK